mmetsp:Transcript_33754/g.57675  ORF Transcript_33754/g.57675 Transcript_33754/m.57675 type:complete len:206 (+) Transcript_33754:1054-1671(+)
MGCFPSRTSTKLNEATRDFATSALSRRSPPTLAAGSPTALRPVLHRRSNGEWRCLKSTGPSTISFPSLTPLYLVAQLRVRMRAGDWPRPARPQGAEVVQPATPKARRICWTSVTSGACSCSGSWPLSASYRGSLWSCTTPAGLPIRSGQRSATPPSSGPARGTHSRCAGKRTACWSVPVGNAGLQAPSPASSHHKRRVCRTHWSV